MTKKPLFAMQNRSHHRRSNQCHHHHHYRHHHRYHHNHHLDFVSHSYKTKRWTISAYDLQETNYWFILRYDSSFLMQNISPRFTNFPLE